MAVKRRQKTKTPKPRKRAKLLKKTTKKKTTKKKTTENNGFFHENLLRHIIEFVFWQSVFPECTDCKKTKCERCSHTVHYMFEKKKKRFVFDVVLKILIGGKWVIIAVFECDGPSHFVAIRKFGGQRGLNDQKKRDKLKKEWCLAENVLLVRIRCYYKKKGSKKLFPNPKLFVQSVHEAIGEVAKLFLSGKRGKAVQVHTRRHWRSDWMLRYGSNPLLTIPNGKTRDDLINT